LFTCVPDVAPNKLEQLVDLLPPTGTHVTAPRRSKATPAGRKPNLHGISADFVEGWIRRNGAERPSNVVPSALERLAFSHNSEERELGSEWVRLSEKDASHLTGLLDIVMSTGDLEVRPLCPPAKWVAGSQAFLLVGVPHAEDRPNAYELLWPPLPTTSLRRRKA
jgi:hypothetical protein